MKKMWFSIVMLNYQRVYFSANLGLEKAYGHPMAIEQQPKLGALNETFRARRSTLARHQIVSPGLIQCWLVEDVGGQAVGGRWYECTILHVCIDIIISHILHIYIYITIIYHLCVIYQYSVHIIDRSIYIYIYAQILMGVCWYNMQSMHINQYSHIALDIWNGYKNNHESSISLYFIDGTTLHPSNPRVLATQQG